jgi:hypothetical protein
VTLFITGGGASLAKHGSKDRPMAENAMRRFINDTGT